MRRRSLDSNWRASFVLHVKAFGNGIEDMDILEARNLLSWFTFLCYRNNSQGGD